jgi:hypothetical protein
MKLLLLPLVLFLFSLPRRRIAFPVTAELCLHPQKNQPPRLALSFISFHLFSPATSFSNPRLPLSPHHLLNLIPQTPSSL